MISVVGITEQQLHHMHLLYSYLRLRIGMHYTQNLWLHRLTWKYGQECASTL